MNAGLAHRLCAVARASIAGGRAHSPAPTPAADLPELAEPGASFVTLRLDSVLRGCIGSLLAEQPLIEDVHTNAWRAANRDPRFPPVSAAEIPRLAIHLSLLTPMQAVAFQTERDLLERLRPGHDGLLIRLDGRQATFLPSVWSQLSDPTAFLAALKRKAGIAPEREDFEALRYGVDDWHCVAPRLAPDREVAG